MTPVGFKTNELLTQHCGCHGNLVTITTRYVADAYHPRKLHTKYDLNRTQEKRDINITLCCHSNLVTTATRYVADAYHPEKASY